MPNNLLSAVVQAGVHTGACLEDNSDSIGDTRALYPGTCGEAKSRRPTKPYNSRRFVGMSISAHDFMNFAASWWLPPDNCLPNTTAHGTINEHLRRLIINPARVKARIVANVSRHNLRQCTLHPRTVQPSKKPHAFGTHARTAFIMC